jgi:hypothetical protein
MISLTPFGDASMLQSKAALYDHGKYMISFVILAGHDLENAILAFHRAFSFGLC